MRVVITEKPSVARDLARVLGARGKANGFIAGDGLRIGWCFGHMGELVQPAHYDPAWRRWDADLLPMLPEHFEIQVRKDAADQVKVLGKLLCDPDTTEVINACDAGREGELIFRYLLQLTGADKPVRRLWVSSMTDKALREAWARMDAGSRYDNLADAARSRSEADWLVGLNATRAMTCLVRQAGGGQLLSVGRVQTPTLAMIVGRDAEIEAFEPEDYWQVRAGFQVGEDEAGRFQATWFQQGGVDEKTDTDGSSDEDDDRKGPSADTRLPTLQAAQAVAAAAEGQTGTVASTTRKRKVEYPPLLHDLTSLQRRANQRYGLSAAQTLEIAQALYERHKLITYPRTDARHLTPDQLGELPGIVEGVGQLAVYAAHAQVVLDRGIDPGKRVIDASEVGDHHAILPTGRVPEGRGLSPDEKRVYDLVARRLLAALSDDALFDVAEIIVAVPPVGDLPDGVHPPLTFRAKGRMCVQAGWQAVDPPRQRKDTDLPLVDQGDALDVASTETKAGRTRPPPPHNDASILKAMETAGRDLDDASLRRAMRQAGLGTPATRAAILTTLDRRGFVTRKGKHLHATDRGKSLIAAVPVEALLSAELTGRWEARLAAIAEGREQRETFMAAVRQQTTEVVAAILAAPPPPAEDIVDEREVLGECPVCGEPVREGKGAFSCATGRSCSFVIFKKIAKRPISKRTATQLLKGETTQVLKNFKSKAGKSFETALTLDEEGKVKFVFPERKRPDPQTAADPAGMACPTCGRGRIMRGRTGWGCDRWREGCGWRRVDKG